MTDDLKTGETLETLQTPCLLLDLDRFSRNAETMLAKAQSAGVALRPHLKTAKSADAARILTDEGRCGIMVSTLAEAEYFFDHGFNDIVYGVVICESKFPRAMALALRGCALGVMVDSLEIAERLAEYWCASSVNLDVYIEIDSDGHRGGVAPESPELLPIARAIVRSAPLQFRGVVTHAGESYNARSGAEMLAFCEVERRNIVRVAEHLQAAGVDCPIVSMGSTPTASYGRDFSGVSELRAGVYGFGDLVQRELGTCSLDAIALSVLATVIGHNHERNRVIIDAGWMALSQDRGTAESTRDWHYGAVCPPGTRDVDQGVTVRSANQEHGLIEPLSGSMDFARYPIGARVCILPNHACATAAAFTEYNVHRGSQVRARWPRHNGW